MIWLIFLAWLSFLAWLGLTKQGREFGELFWKWINPWDYSCGIVDGNAMREEERQQEVMKEQAERAAAHQKEVIERNRKRRELMAGQPDFASFIPASRPGMQIQQYESIKTNERKFRVVDPDSNQKVEVTVRPDELLACKTPQEQSLLVERKIQAAIQAIKANPVLGEVQGGVQVTPEEYNEKFAPDGKRPMSAEDHLVAEILGAKPEDYKEDAEFESGH